MYAPLTRFVTYRTVMAASMLLFAVTCFVCGAAQSLGAILVARILMGIAAASAIPLGLMVIGEFFEKEMRGRLVGGFFSSAFVASLAGITLGGLANWRWLFYVPAVLGILVALGFIIFSGGLLTRVHVGHINYLRAIRNIDIVNVCILIFVLSFLYHGVYNWYGIYLSRIYHLAQFQISLCFIVASLGGLTGQVLGGVLSDKKGRLFSCWAGILGLSIGTMLLVGTYPVMILWMVFLLISTGWTVGHNGISTVLTDFPDDDRPMIASLNSFVRFFGGGLGFCASAYFVEKSFSGTFFVIGVLMFVASLFATRLIPR